MEGDKIMNLDLELALVCERVMDLLEELKEGSLITEEEYENHSRLKLEYLERNLTNINCQ